MIHHHCGKGRGEEGEGGVLPHKQQPITVRELVEISIKSTIMNTEIGLGSVQVRNENPPSFPVQHDFFSDTGIAGNSPNNVWNMHGR